MLRTVLTVSTKRTLGGLKTIRKQFKMFYAIIQASALDLSELWLNWSGSTDFLSWQVNDHISCWNGCTVWNDSPVQFLFPYGMNELKNTIWKLYDPTGPWEDPSHLFLLNKVATMWENIQCKPDWLIHVGRIQWLQSLLIFFFSTSSVIKISIHPVVCDQAKAKLVVDTRGYKPAYITSNFDTLTCTNTSHLFYITELYQSKIIRKEECLYFPFPSRTPGWFGHVTKTKSGRQTK